MEWTSFQRRSSTHVSQSSELFLSPFLRSVHSNEKKRYLGMLFLYRCVKGGKLTGKYLHNGVHCLGEITDVNFKFPCSFFSANSNFFSSVKRDQRWISPPTISRTRSLESRRTSTPRPTSSSISTRRSTKTERGLERMEAHSTLAKSPP